MEVVLKNGHKFDANFYKGIEINEFSEENKYLVKFFGRDVWFDSELIGDRPSDSLEGLSSEDKIKEIIRNYLSSTKINSFTGIISTCSCYGNIVFKALGTRTLLFNICNFDLRTVMDDVFNKYRQDRFDFCYGNDKIKAISIDVSSLESSYGIMCDKLYPGDENEEEIIYLNLKISKNGLIASEFEFIQELIVDMFSKYNEEIKMEKVYDTDDECTRFVEGYVLKCGDMRIYFPRYTELLWIIGLVDKYNEELREVQEDVKRRQLKMEGF